MLFDVKKIVKILEANNVDYDPQFAHLRALPFPSDECVTFADELVKKIESLAVYGLNHKMKDVEKVVGRLIDTTIRLGSPNASKKLIKIKKEVEKDKELSKVMAKVKENNIDIRVPLKTYLESTEKGVNILLERNIKTDSKINAKYLEEAKKLLVEINTKLDAVVDYSSKKAVVFANECISSIQEYRFKATQHEVTSDAIKCLKDISQSLDKWGNLNTKISLLNPMAKQEEISEYQEDEFEYTVLNADFLEKVEAFKENIDNQENSINKKYNTSSLESYIEEVENEQKSKLQELEQIINNVRNGKVHQDDVMEDLSLLDEQIEDLKEVVAENKETLNTYKAAKLQDLRLLNRIKEIHRKIMMYEEDPVLFGTMAEQLDFGGLISIIRGVLTDEDADQVFNEMEVFLRYIEELNKNKEAYQKRASEIQKRFNVRAQERRNKAKEEQRAKTKVEGSKTTTNLNDLINKYHFGNEIKAPVTGDTKEPVKEKEEKEENIIKERDISKL